MTPARYSTRPFPPYAYVPGETPHPLRDPRGHSYGRFERTRASALDPRAWWTCEDYRYAIDLFNHRYYWEAHEAIEGLWVAAGRDTDLGRGLQGLIQIAVGQLKWRLGQTMAAHTLNREGWAKLPRAGHWLGVDVVPLRASIDAQFAGRNPDPPRILLDLPAQTNPGTVADPD
jgi:hypothetical protein